jgi:hypothetical protein
MNNRWQEFYIFPKEGFCANYFIAGSSDIGSKEDGERLKHQDCQCLNKISPFLGVLTKVVVVVIIIIYRVTPEITAQLLATMDHKVESGGILATQLCSHMQDANLINSSRLNNLAGINTLFFSSLQCTGHCPASILRVQQKLL